MSTKYNKQVRNSKQRQRRSKPQAARHKGCPWVQQQQAIQEVSQRNVQKYCENDKDYPNEDKQVFIGSLGVCHNPLYLPETQRLVDERKLYTKIGFRHALIGHFWHGGAEERLSKSRTSCMIGLGSTVHFF